MISLLQFTRKSSIKMMKWILFLLLLLSTIFIIGHFGQGILRVLDAYRFHFFIERWIIIAGIYVYWDNMHAFLKQRFKLNVPEHIATDAIRNKVVLSLVLFELIIVERIPLLFVDFIKGLFV